MTLLKTLMFLVITQLAFANMDGTIVCKNCKIVETLPDDFYKLESLFKNISNKSSSQYFKQWAYKSNSQISSLIYNNHKVECTGNVTSPGYTNPDSPQNFTMIKYYFDVFYKDGTNKAPQVSGTVYYSFADSEGYYTDYYKEIAGNKPKHTTLSYEKKNGRIWFKQKCSPAHVGISKVKGLKKGSKVYMPSYSCTKGEFKKYFTISNFLAEYDNKNKTDLNDIVAWAQTYNKHLVPEIDPNDERLQLNCKFIPYKVITAKK